MPSVVFRMRLSERNMRLLVPLRAEARLAFKALVKATPVRTGRLRRGWRFRALKRGFSIINRVPYSVYVNARLGLTAFYLDPETLIERAERRWRNYKRNRNRPVRVVDTSESEEVG